LLGLLLFLQIEIKEVDGVCPSPSDTAGQVVTYLEEKGFLHEQELGFEGSKRRPEGVNGSQSKFFTGIWQLCAHILPLWQ
jgi:hypothetical protein